MWLSPNEVCIGVAVSVKHICARFITVSVKKLLHYRAGGLLQYRAVLLHYRAVITVSGVLLHYRAVITVSGVYYIIGRLLHYRLVQQPLVGNYRVQDFSQPEINNETTSSLCSVYTYTHGLIVSISWKK